MIKAKKGLLIALFAAMMVFAFGATSAFAAAGDTWDLPNGKATINGQTYDIDDIVFQSDGLTVATVNAPGVSVVDGTYAAYVIDNASIADYRIGSSGLFTGTIAANMDYATYSSLETAAKDPSVGLYVELKLKKPAYADAEVDTITSKIVPYANLTNWNVTAQVTHLERSTQNQTGTFSPIFKVISSGAASAVILGDPAVTTVNVLADATQALVDENGRSYPAGGAYTVRYDGKPHVLTANDVAGYTVAYEKFNTSTAKWDAIDAISVKNVADSGDYRAVYTKTANNAKSYVGVTATVNPLTGVFGFTWDSAFSGVPANSRANPLKVSQTAAPADFVVSGVKDADKAEAAQYFADAYSIEVTKDTADSSIESWAVDVKEGVKPADVNKKYEGLLENYFVTPPTTAFVSQSMTTVYVQRSSVGEKDDDINFVNAPNMTYKAKKLKKKSYSFTVEAKADSGNVITYAISSPTSKITIDAATGKVTVAKGLKKGTYKVTVKAKTAGGNGYKACTEKAELKIKVKK